MPQQSHFAETLFEAVEINQLFWLGDGAVDSASVEYYKPMSYAILPLYAVAQLAHWRGHMKRVRLGLISCGVAEWPL